jgi:hypothetical protein
MLPRLKQCEIAESIAYRAGYSYILGRNARNGMSPFDQGVVAAETGMSKDDNPYQPGTSAYSDWNAGYESVVEADEATRLDGE